MLVVGVGSSRCDTGAVQDYPIGRLEHQNRGQTSLVASDVEAGEHPIELYEEAVVEAIQPHLQDPDEQN